MASSLLRNLTKSSNSCRLSARNFSRSTTQIRADNDKWTQETCEFQQKMAPFRLLNARNFSLDLRPTEIGNHTAKWMQDTSKKSPMELINEIPPIKVEGRIVACEGDTNPALGHPIEFICLDLKEPAICKYCGLRYVQVHHH